MEQDETLNEFLHILARIKDLLGEAAISGSEAVDLDDAMQRLRKAGNNDDADELAELIRLADELKAQHQPKS
jgi:hypothetical protein